MAPKKLRFQKDAKQLVLEYEGGEPLAIPFELLRVESPSAEVQGHGGERPPPVRGKQDVGVVRAEPVGHYAIRIIFDDTGCRRRTRRTGRSLRNPYHI